MSEDYGEPDGKMRKIDRVFISDMNVYTFFSVFCQNAIRRFDSPN